MKPIQVIEGRMVPLRRANVDTDQIMPKQFLKRVERTGYGQFLFHDWRAQDGFVLDRPEYAGAKILLSGPNFGCGSSREHAPWGLQDWGFDAVIASSFADIFRTNCTKVGLLPVELSEKEVQWLMELAEAEPAAEVRIDLERQAVTYSQDGTEGESSFEAFFEIDPFTKWRLLNGLDDIGLTLRHEGEIADYERRRHSFLPSMG